MTGIHKGFVSLLKQELNHEVISFHCIIHQEALYAHSCPSEFPEVMDLVMKIKKIMAKGLNHQQFHELLEEVNSEYSDLLHNKVCWLSRAQMLAHFAACLEEVKKFLEEKGHHEYAYLTNPEWLQKFHFLIDITSHLNELNSKLQGKGNTALMLLKEVLSFERKLSLLEMVREALRFTFLH